MIGRFGAWRIKVDLHIPQHADELRHDRRTSSSLVDLVKNAPAMALANIRTEHAIAKMTTTLARHRAALPARRARCIMGSLMLTSAD